MSPILFLLFFTAIFSQNLPVYSKKTISDVLYSDSKFSEVVKTLQRTMLLPYLNRLETATLFAPTNQAFKDDPYVTQERMLYHILRREIKAEEFRDGQLLTTHMKLEGKLGPGKIGQKVRVDFVADDDFEEKNDTQVYVGHGKIVEFDLEADNGIIHVIDKVLYTPNDIFTTLSSVDQLHTFANYLNVIGMDEDLLRGNHTTIFAPTDDAINSILKFHERQYLVGECGGGLGDLSLLLNHHLNNTNVLYSESFGVGITNVSTVQGEPIKVEKDEQGHMHVANGTVPLKDVLAENGVIHVFNNISVPNELRFTTLKYLCGLRATKFIKAMESYGLQHYLKDSNKSYTILAPRDEFFDDGLITSFGLNTLKYHVIEGKYLPSDLYHDMHIKTELRTEGLRDQRQRATVSIIQRWYVDGDGDGDDNETQRTELRFNDAIVLDQPVEIGNSIIYILSKTLKPPPSIMTVLGNDGQLSSINLFISISNMIPKVRSAKGSTMFAPSKEAVKQLGLIASYFLHPDAREDLRSVVSYHLMNDTIYSDEIPTGESTHYTLGGEPIKVTKTKDDIFVGDADDTSKISKKDVLTSTGVLHVIDKILMPPTLQITVAKLLKGMNANSFLRIVEAAKLTELVQDPEKPFTIFVPTENAFRKINVSRLIMDDEVAGRWARMHIIPSTMGELEDGTEVPTLLSDDVKLVIKRDYILGGYYVEIKGIMFTHARLLSGGKTWNGGAVYEIDKVLLPDRDSGSIGTMFLTVIVSLLLSGFTLIGCIGCVHFWQVWKRRRGYREIPS